jgi:uncharacterized protein
MSLRMLWMPAAAVLLLAGCATPVTRFHSLLPPPETAAQALQAATAREAFELLPVGIAVAVDRPQWVLRRDDGAQAMLEHERWIAPLADEVHAALALHLRRATLAALPAGQQGPWRIRLDVRRWDARLGHGNRLEALWSLQTGTAPLRHCQISLLREAGSTIDALAASHRALVAALADAVVASTRAC